MGPRVLGSFLKIKMFLVLDFEHTYIKKWCYASGVERKSCEVSNQMFREEDELTKWLWQILLNKII